MKERWRKLEYKTKAIIISGVVVFIFLSMIFG